MAEEIGALIVRLDAKIANFERAMERARRTMSSSTRAIETRAKKTDDRLARFGARFGIAIGAAFSVAAIRQFLGAVDAAVNKLDEIAKTADSIGITTDALQELRVVADLAGISSDQLDTAMKRFARTALDAGNGLQAAERSFARVGVEVRNADGSFKNIEQLLLETADGFARLQDGAEKTGTAMELFGRSGAAIVNLMNEGSAGIASQREEVRKLGLVYREDLLRAAEVTKDKLTLLRKEIEVDLTKALIDAGPFVLELTRLLSLLADVLGFVARQVGDGVEGLRLLAGVRVDTPLLAARQIREELAGVNADIEDTKARIEALSDVGNVPVGEMPLRRSASGELEPDIDALLQERTDAIERAQDDLENLESRQAKLVNELGTVLKLPQIDLVPEPAEPVEPVEPSGTGKAKKSETGEQLARLRERIGLLGREQELAGKSALQQAILTAAFEKQRIVEEFSNAAKREGVSLTPEMTAQAAALAEQFERESVALAVLNDVLARHEDAQRDAAEAARESEQQITAIADAITNAILQADSFADSLKNVAVALANILGQDLAKRGESSILGSLFSGIGSIAGSAFGGGSGTAPAIVPGSPSAKGNVFSKGNIVPFAKGGIVSRPTVFPMARGAGLMGEAGPEAIMPLSRGPDGRLGVSGGGVTVQIINNTPAQVREERSRGPSGEDVRKFIVEEMQKATANGQIDRQMGSRFGLSPQRLVR